MASSPLEFDDLSQTCLVDRFCQICVSTPSAPTAAAPITAAGRSTAHAVDTAGRPVFSTTFEFGPSQHWLRDLVVGTIAAGDYAARRPRDSYCALCKDIFCAGACTHHHDTCGPDAVLRIEEHAGTGAHCVRYTGSDLFQRIKHFIDSRTTTNLQPQFWYLYGPTAPRGASDAWYVS